MYTGYIELGFKALTFIFFLVSVVISGLTLIILLTSAILIYKQLKQTEKSIRGSTYLGMMRDVTVINKIFLDNPELAALWGDVEYVGVKGEPNEIKKAWVITIMMDFYENMFFQYEQGNVPEEIWERWRRHIINVFKNTEVGKQWRLAKDVYYRPFRDFVNSGICGN